MDEQQHINDWADWLEEMYEISRGKYIDGAVNTDEEYNKVKTYQEWLEELSPDEIDDTINIYDTMLYYRSKGRDPYEDRILWDKFHKIIYDNMLKK